MLLNLIRNLRYNTKSTCTSIIVEGDLEEVITALRSKEESLSSFGHLIFSTKQSLDAFHSISFSQIHRSGVAHNLTKHVSSFLVWMENVPPCFQHVLLVYYG